MYIFDIICLSELKETVCKCVIHNYSFESFVERVFYVRGLHKIRTKEVKIGCSENPVEGGRTERRSRYFCFVLKSGLRVS